ncbi:hypothetical protein ACFQY8_00100 [Alloscardovia venturai]|uniref:ABC transporter permease n=1 Tax=Alloscardovia venturai TaxID=1769421 RepID=A0ABW2Y1N3_9BIFI
MTSHKLSSRMKLSIFVLICSLMQVVASIIAPNPNGEIAQGFDWLLYSSMIVNWLSWMAVPVIAWFVAQRVRTIMRRSRTSDARTYGMLAQYAVFLLLLALICESPFDYARTGVWWSLEIQNPLWALVLSIVAVIGWKAAEYYDNAARVTVRVIVLIVALLACIALKTFYGLLVMVLIYTLCPVDFSVKWKKIAWSRQLIVITGAIISGVSALVGVSMVNRVERSHRKNTRNLETGKRVDQTGRVTTHGAYGQWFLWWAYPALLVMCVLIRLAVVTWILR